MIHRFALPILTAAALLSAPLAAQLELQVSGRVETAQAGSCNAAATHRLACTDILLLSSQVDLTQFEGTTVDLSGNLVGQLGCVTLEVTQIAAATDYRLSSFSLSNYRIGTTMTLLSTAPFGTPLVQFFAVGNSFLPLGSFGSYLLDPLSTDQFAFDVGLGQFPLPRFISIPNDPAIVGCEPHFQFLAVDIANPLASRLGHSICFTIRA